MLQSGKTFIVVREPYSRYGSEPLMVSVEKSESVGSLLKTLLENSSSMIDDWNEEEKRELTEQEIIERFKNINGDGFDYFDIRELSEDLTVSDCLL